MHQSRPCFCVFIFYSWQFLMSGRSTNKKHKWSSNTLAAFAGKRLRRGFIDSKISSALRFGNGWTRERFEWEPFLRRRQRHLSRAVKSTLALFYLNVWPNFIFWCKSRYVYGATMKYMGHEKVSKEAAMTSLAVKCFFALLYLNIWQNFTFLSKSMCVVQQLDTSWPFWSCLLELQHQINALQCGMLKIF